MSLDVADDSVNSAVMPEIDSLAMFPRDVADCSTDSVSWVSGTIANFIAVSLDAADGSIYSFIIPITDLPAAFSSDAASDGPIIL